jgi:Rps23 Pro-64 3,4-dihydroxylase Tpa1-like proline 4-hydroxylase
MNSDTPQEPTRRLVFESDQVAVFDDFLDRSVFLKVLGYCGGDQYQAVHTHGWRKAWRINDGSPLQGGTVCAGSSELLQEASPRTRYPIGADIDLFIEQLLSVLPEVQKIVGSQGHDWSTFTASTWIYPAGSSLSLHQDGYRYSGAFAYFAHRSWNIHWGGCLLVLDPKTSKVDSGSETAADSSLAWLDDTIENNRLWDPGLAQCIFPKPNRLVFISPHAEHLLSRVDSNSGHRARISISGFFQRRPRAGSLG